MLKEVLKHVKTVAIGGHVRPDGDCVGSCLGLYQYIKENYEEIQADVYLEDIPDSFHFIKAAKDETSQAAVKEVRAFIRSIQGFKKITITERAERMLIK